MAKIGKKWEKSGEKWEKVGNSGEKWISLTQFDAICWPYITQSTGTLYMYTYNKLSVGGGGMVNFRTMLLRPTVINLFPNKLTCILNISDIDKDSITIYG